MRKVKILYEEKANEYTYKEIIISPNRTTISYIYTWICYLLHGENIGAVSIYLNKDNVEGNIGWIINKKYRRNGYAEEAAKGILNFAVQELRVRKFVAHCDSENVGSYRVMERLGMLLVSKIQGRKNKSSKKEWKDVGYENN